MAGLHVQAQPCCFRNLSSAFYDNNSNSGGLDFLPTHMVGHLYYSLRCCFGSLRVGRKVYERK